MFGLSIIPYLFVSLSQIHQAYLGSLLQNTAYPLILGLFLPSAAAPRSILRTAAWLLVLQAAITAVFSVATLARGRLTMLEPVSLSAVTDADSLVMGAMGFITFAWLQPAEDRATGGGRLKRRAWIAGAVLLALLSLPTFSRATIGGFLLALVVLAVLRFRRRLAAVRLTRLAVLVSILIPAAVWLNIIKPQQLSGVSALIIRKRAAEQYFGSTLVRRAVLWQAFMSRVTWTDVVGTRPALHQYDYYHGLGVKQSIETPHNYWISMVLTAGYGGTLVLLYLWDHFVRLAGRARDPAVRLTLTWFAFIAVQGVTGRGAFLGLLTLAFWCAIAAAVAAAPSFRLALGATRLRRVPLAWPPRPPGPLRPDRPGSAVDPPADHLL
jgi:hypothetical protein